MCIRDRLSGIADLTYTNNSPDTLKEMYFHYWANAYKDNSTALSKQLVERGNKKLFFANNDERGGYRKITIIQGLDTLKSKMYKRNPDVIHAVLSEPLLPGAVGRFSLPFTITIPKMFSRMGRSMNGYQITQWYPKPAVYDRDGWHPMPYLDQGEFYSEFGDYEVEITLPQNYIVAATGQLTDANELAFLAEEINKAKPDYPKGTKETAIPSSDKLKTITYTATQVHDFAWFADKGFIVDGSKVMLSSGKQISTYAFYIPTVQSVWKNATTYINRSVRFLSDAVGEYPYPQATAVAGPLDAGGGMEYPMITIISENADTTGLDNVIHHELGHNWFYGILASNERKYPWMDEGINSYYEYRYMDLYYPKKRKNFSMHNLMHSGLRYQQLYGFAQPLQLEAADYGLINYGTDIYHKTAILFSLLEKQFGQVDFDRRMQSFYNAWKFRHPGPADLAAQFQSAEHDVSWLFDRSMHTVHTDDYKIGHITADGNKVLLTVQNSGQLGAPLKIEGYKNAEPAWAVWQDGFTGKKALELSQQGGVDEIRLNWYDQSIDQNNRNQRSTLSGKALRPVRLKFGTGIEKTGNTNLYWLPVLSYNVYDKLMTGVVLHNLGLPGRRFEFVLAPQCSFGGKDLAGNATVQYLLPLKGVDNAHAKFGAQARLYSLYTSKNFDYTERYLKVQPYISYYFANPPGRKVTNKLTLQSTLLRFKEYDLKFDSNSTFIGKEVAHRNRIVNSLTFMHKNTSSVTPLLFKSGAQHFSYTYFDGEKRNRIRWINELKTDFYYSAKHAVTLRAWAGIMVYNSHKAEDENGFINYQEGVLSLFSNGIMDNLAEFDGLFIGRNEQQGLASAQMVGNQNGGFKGAFNNALTSGISNTYLASVNIEADMPFSLAVFPLKAYVDAGFGPMALAGADETKFLWEFGAMLNYQDIFRIHLPIVFHDELKYLYSQTRGGKFLSRVSFSLDLHKLNFRFWKNDLNKLFNQ